MALLEINEEYNIASEILKMYSDAKENETPFIKISFNKALADELQFDIMSDTTFLNVFTGVAQILLNNEIITRYTIRVNQDDITFRMLF